MTLALDSTKKFVQTTFVGGEIESESIFGTLTTFLLLHGGYRNSDVARAAFAGPSGPNLERSLYAITELLKEVKNNGSAGYDGLNLVMSITDLKFVFITMQNFKATEEEARTLAEKLGVVDINPYLKLVSDAATDLLVFLKDGLGV